MLIESLILLLGNFEVVFVSVPLHERTFRDAPSAAVLLKLTLSVLSGVCDRLLKERSFALCSDEPVVLLESSLTVC